MHLKSKAFWNSTIREWTDLMSSQAEMTPTLLILLLPPGTWAKTKKGARHLISNQIPCYRSKLKCSKCTASLPDQPYQWLKGQRHQHLQQWPIPCCSLHLMILYHKNLASVNPGPTCKIPLFCYIWKSILELSAWQQFLFPGNSEFLQGLTPAWMLHMKKAS